MESHMLPAVLEENISCHGTSKEELCSRAALVGVSTGVTEDFVQVTSELSLKGQIQCFGQRNSPCKGLKLS